MSIFFNSQSIVPAASVALRAALNTNPDAVANRDQRVHDLAVQVKDQVTGTFAYGRFFCALLLVVLLFGGGIYTAEHQELKEWSAVLLHTFELALGGLMGIAIGERTAKS